MLRARHCHETVSERVWEVIMKNQAQFVRRATGAIITATSSLFSLFLFAPSAFAFVARPVGDGSSAAVAPQTAPATSHVVVSTGMAGWQVVLIAVATALLTAAIAVFVDRARRGKKNVSISAA
jgi:hypothetical protein